MRWTTNLLFSPACKALCLSAALLAPAARAAPCAASHHLVYAEPRGQALTGELYLPQTAGSHPMLVAVHGGDWKYASAELYRHWGCYLARHGYALFAINYRLVRGDENRYPAAVEDVRTALRFVRAQASVLHVDAGRLGLVGDSAGAQAAALAALTDDPPSGTSPLKALVGIYGVYDLTAQWQDDHVRRPDDDIVGDYLGAAPAQAPTRYAEASPLRQIRPAISNASAAPAVLLAWGTRDARVDSQAQSAAFLRALQDAGYAAQAVVIDGAPHYWASDPIKPRHNYPGYLAPRLLRFLQRHL